MLCDVRMASPVPVLPSSMGWVGFKVGSAAVVVVVFSPMKKENQQDSEGP